MEFLLGVVITIAYFVCAFVAYNMGKRSNLPAVKEVSEEERRKVERERKGFNDMMAYDVTTAMKGKR